MVRQLFMGETPKTTLAHRSGFSTWGDPKIALAPLKKGELKTAKVLRTAA